jgi:mannose/fructose/N-acetylgalactosamine-specific phosphotransferase system component IIC
MHDLVIIAIVAGLLALDDRAGWQSLFGEPVFSALIIGLLFGHLGAALRCGVVLQLVWLSIGAARGSRRPHAVVGGVVGAGTACLSLHKTGDPREPLVIAAAVLCGLLAGEAGQWVSARAGVLRERWLENFKLPADGNVASRNLTLYVVGSAAYVAVVDALVAAVAVAVSLEIAELIIDRGGAMSTALSVWLGFLPAVAVATIAHAFATRALSRTTAFGFFLAVVAAWLI